MRPSLRLNIFNGELQPVVMLCLLAYWDSIGKTFERIIVDRLEDHLRAKRDSLGTVRINSEPMLR